MSDEAVQYGKALRAAGQPWSGRGVRTAGAGIITLALLQVALSVGLTVPYALYVLVAVVAVIAVGWVMLIVAVVKRRRWAKEHPIADVPLGEPTATGAP